MANLIYESRYDGIRKEGQTYHCTYCNKSYNKRKSAKQHFSTLHKGNDTQLRPGDVSRAIASKSKQFSKVADRLDVSIGRLHSFVKNNSNFYIRKHRPDGNRYIGEIM